MFALQPSPGSNVNAVMKDVCWGVNTACSRTCVLLLLQGILKMRMTKCSQQDCPAAAGEDAQALAGAGAAGEAGPLGMQAQLVQHLAGGHLQACMMLLQQQQGLAGLGTC
jgi:hypothetical protein